jgi:sulfate/thiosulfate transport system permease protein
MADAGVVVKEEKRRDRRRRHALPGLIPTLGFTWLYLTVLVLLPLSWLVLRASQTPWSRVIDILSSPRTQSALRLSFGCAIAAAFINVGFGLVTAWVLARYKFPGRGLLDAIVELPFAVPTSVAGITLTFLYSERGWIGKWLAGAGLKVAFTPLGIIVAVTFVGLPFVVRTVQPVLQEMDRQAEEAARSLGATAWQTFWRVQFPLILPALITGFALSLARGIGEYGSVLFISGNLPLRTEVTPLLIVSKLEQYDYEGAAVLAATMLVVSLALLIFVHVFERWVSRRFSGVQVGR